MCAVSQPKPCLHRLADANVCKAFTRVQVVYIYSVDAARALDAGNDAHLFVGGLRLHGWPCRDAHRLDRHQSELHVCWPSSKLKREIPRPQTLTRNRHNPNTCVQGWQRSHLLLVHLPHGQVIAGATLLQLSVYEKSLRSVAKRIKIFHASCCCHPLFTSACLVASAKDAPSQDSTEHSLSDTVPAQPANADAVDCFF